MSRYNAETEATYVVGFDYAERNVISALRDAYEAGTRESAEVAVAEAYRCGYEAGAAEVGAHLENE